MPTPAQLQRILEGPCCAESALYSVLALSRKGRARQTLPLLCVHRVTGNQLRS